MSFLWRSQDYKLECIKELKNWCGQFNTQKNRVLEDSFQALTCLAYFLQCIKAHLQLGEQESTLRCQEKLEYWEVTSKHHHVFIFTSFFFMHIIHLFAAHWLPCRIWERTLASPQNFHFEAKQSFQDICLGYNLAGRNLCWNQRSLLCIAHPVKWIDLCGHVRTVAE